MDIRHPSFAGKYTLVRTMDWWDYDACNDAFRIHGSYHCEKYIEDCLEIEASLISEHEGLLFTVEYAFGEAHERFPLTLTDYGFSPLIAVCDCAGGYAVKQQIFQIDWIPRKEWMSA